VWPVCSLSAARGFCCFLFCLGLASRASREEMLLSWRPGWWVVPMGIGYSIAVHFAVAVVLVLIGGILLATHLFTPQELQESLSANRPDVEVLVDVSAMQNNSAYFWLIVTFNSFVVAGLREEIWRAGTLAGMRALWPDTFGGRDGGIAAVALIALLFGAAHFSMGILAAGIAGLLGLLLGIIMVAHRSIWPAVIAHGLFDATTFALLPWASEHLRQLN
jgi:membrane protease YdiL (CAAX protease family)